ncbi:MAG: TIGR04053 family radical SAM/SPASM domain-containing protein [Chloroflexi bacterium]|nr:TIGR04053 family radical SAM/SPASM domain-containing protein [Chloroflexota bacterium]
MHKKPIRSPAYNLNDRPFMVIWETTNACDLSCRHCRAEAIAEVEPGTLTTAEGKALLDQIEAFGKPRPIVILTGGDPFKREDIFELTAYGTEIGLPMAVSPSGTPLLNRDNLRRLKEAGTKAISLSIDGSTPELHDNFRRVPGSFQMTLDGWRAAHDVGLKLQLNTTVTRYNLWDLPEIFRLVQELGVMTWSLFFLVPTGRGRYEDEIEPEAYEDVMNWLYDASKLLSVKTTEGHHFKRIVLQRSLLDELGVDPVEVMGLGETYHRLKAHFDEVADFSNARYIKEDRMRRTPMHINAGNGFVFISRRGEVFPSGFMPVEVGSVREASLVDIYRESPLFNTLRDPDAYQGRCGTCEFRNVCGGSRSRAYAVTGQATGEEPFCTYEPGSFPYIDQLEPYLQR